MLSVPVRLSVSFRAPRNLPYPSDSRICAVCEARYQRKAGGGVTTQRGRDMLQKMYDRIGLIKAGRSPAVMWSATSSGGHGSSAWWCYAWEQTDELSPHEMLLLIGLGTLLAEVRYSSLRV